jgi:hypothetical protein
LAKECRSGQQFVQVLGNILHLLGKLNLFTATLGLQLEL